jgi:hypothetical protein
MFHKLVMGQSKWLVKQKDKRSRIPKFNFGQNIWDKSVMLLGTSWEHIENKKT